MKLEIQVDAKTVVIPDLWHIAMDLGGYHTAKGREVLTTWHLAHDMKNALTNLQKLDAESVEDLAAVLAKEECVLSPGKRHRQRAEELLDRHHTLTKDEKSLLMYVLGRYIIENGQDDDPETVDVVTRVEAVENKISEGAA
jgi:hypothetical protein